MEQKAKFIIVGLIGLLIVCLFLFIQTLNSKQQLMRERDELRNENVALSSKTEKLSGELKSAQINNEQLQRDKSVLELDLNNLRRENDDIKRQLEYNKKAMDSLTQELVREKNDKLQIQDSFKSIKNEKVDFDKKIKQLQEEKASLERKLAEMETALTSGAEIKAPLKTKESVELPPIIVHPQPQAQIQEPADFLGKILTVDRENDFTIINLGEESGVKIGDTFGVYREGKKIANIEVIKTSKSVAACDITQETTPIGIDDTIR